MVRISVIAAFGAAIFLGGCQQDAKPLMGGQMAGGPPLAPSERDIRLITRYAAVEAYQKAVAAGTYNGTGTLDIPTKVHVNIALGVPPESPLRADLGSKGKRWQFTPRYPGRVDDLIVYGAAIEGDGYLGNLAVLMAASGRGLLPWNLDAEAESKRTADFTPIRGQVTRASGEASYAIYQAVNRQCVIFVQSLPSLHLTGDICAPVGEKLGKARVEAIVNSMGLVPQIPIKPSPDLASILD